MQRAFVALLFLVALPVRAQFTDDFSDGDFTADPAWHGHTERWRILIRSGNPWLGTSGVSAADTLYLGTPSSVSYGTWRFTFAHEGVNLSTSNGARIFLTSDRANVRRTARGYFVQFGTNNSDEVRLYRQDGDPGVSANRVLLGSSAAGLTPGDEGTYRVEVNRYADGRWTVRVNDVEAFSATDATYPASSHFGLWVKHSSATGRAFFFDDFEVTGEPAPPDVKPPRIQAVRYDDDVPALAVRFDEPIRYSTATPERFSLEPPHAFTLSPLDTDPGTTGVLLRFNGLLSTGSYAFRASGVEDLSGNVLRDTTLAFTVSRDETPPRITFAVAPDSRTVQVSFDEPVANACETARYSISPGMMDIGRVDCPVGEVAAVALTLTGDLSPGVLYTLTARALRDLRGNVRDETSATFALPADPLPRDLVVNEIMFDPPDARQEFFEVYNRSMSSFDLSRFRFSDNRSIQTVITETPTFLPPGGYAVIARDTAALRLLFPQVQAMQPASWPALNNDADAVVIFFGGAVIDSVGYTASWGLRGVSLERLDPDVPNVRQNFGATSDPRGGTPGAQNSRYAPDLTPPVPVYAEQTDARTVVVDFSEPIDPATATSAFSVGGPSPVSVILSESGVRATLAFSQLLAGDVLTVTGVRDLKGNVRPQAAIALATLPGAGDLVVNEIMFAPLQNPNDGIPDQPEYVEFFNRSRRTVTLNGLLVTGDPNEFGVADTLRLNASRRSVPPGGFVVIYDADASDTDPATDSRLSRSFPSIDLSAPEVVLLPITAVTRGGLSNSGERLRLERAGIIIDNVFYRATWHDASRGTLTGVALERLDPEGTSEHALNWTSSLAPGGGTPGHPNSVIADPEAELAAPGEIVLNEVMYEPLARPDDGRPDQYEYVEVFNRGTRRLDLNGFFVTDAPNEDGDADTVRIAFRPSVLEPGTYAVFYRAPSNILSTRADSLFRAAFPSASAALLLPLRSGFTLPNAGDLVRLHRPDGAVIDEVRYAPSWHNPGLAVAAGVALERIDPEAPSGERRNWGSSAAAEGGTPGTRNTLTLDPSAPGLPDRPGIAVSPSPFSPDSDGFDDTAFVRYRLESPSSTLRVRIFDSAGRHVRTLEALAGPEGQVAWDGLDDIGRSLQIGIYIVLLEALDTDGGRSVSYKAPVVLARSLD